MPFTRALVLAAALVLQACGGHADAGPDAGAALDAATPDAGNSDAWTADGATVDAGPPAVVYAGLVTATMRSYGTPGYTVGAVFFPGSPDFGQASPPSCGAGGITRGNCCEGPVRVATRGARYRRPPAT